MSGPVSDIQKQIDDLGKQLELSSRRLQILKEKEARDGGNVGPEVLLEIEDLEAIKIPRLKDSLQQLKKEVETVAAKTKFSDRLQTDHVLDQQFKTLKMKWADVANNVKTLPGLMKDWSEYAEIIDQIADDLVPIDWGSEDIFVLSCAIYLHKIGLIPTNRSKDVVNVFNQYPLLSRKIISDSGHILGIDASHIEDVAWICYGHRDLVRDDGSSEATLSVPELKVQTQKGRRTRAELAYYLKILSMLGGLNVNVSDVTAQIFFQDTTSDYVENRMNSVVSRFEIRPPSENAERVISLFPRLSERDLVEDIRFLQKARENLDNAIKDCPSQVHDKTLSDTRVEIDNSAFTQELASKVPTRNFSGFLQAATRKSVISLLDARYGKGDEFLKGWGPVFFYPRGIAPESPRFPKDVQDARVANTAEVLLAFATWLDCADSKDDVISHVVEAINDVIPSLKSVQVLSIAKRNSSLDANRLGLPQGKFNPLASLTFVVPTTRVNSLFVLAAAHLLHVMGRFPGLNSCRHDAYQIMGECIGWLCSTDTGPFNDQIIRFLPNEYLFQSILAFRALINSREYWDSLNMNFSYDIVLAKIAEFVRTLLRRYGEEIGWPAVPFKAMALEILLFYREQLDERLFNQKIGVDRLIKNFAQDLISESRLDGSLPWKDGDQTLIDEDRRHSRQWTHVTSVWALEGLTRCATANLLTPKQKSQLLQTIPMVLLKQNRDGFYDSVPHPDDPENTTIHSVFKTALYTYAMVEARKILPGF